MWPPQQCPNHFEKHLPLTGIFEALRLSVSSKTLDYVFPNFGQWKLLIQRQGDFYPKEMPFFPLFLAKLKQIIK